MIRRLLAAATVLATLTLGAFVGSTAASADPYPPAPPTSLSASVYDPCAGASNDISGTGFQKGETVVLRLTGAVVGTAVVRADGTFAVTITIPLNARGSGELVATGLLSKRTASLSLAFSCVSGQSAGEVRTGGGLAYTGAAIGGALLAVVVLLGAGTAFAVAGRRRRGATRAPH